MNLSHYSDHDTLTSGCIWDPDAIEAVTLANPGVGAKTPDRT